MPSARLASVVRLPTAATSRASLAMVAAAVIALTAAPRAHAHAELLETTPANDEVVATSPDEVTLRFSEPVETVFGSIRVLDVNGTRADTGSLLRPDDRAVGVALRPDLPGGTYTVGWRVVSDDGHPEFGAFVFHVGAPSAGSGGNAGQALAQNAPSKALKVAFTAIRFLSISLVLACVGGTAALALVLTGAAADVRSRLFGVVVALALGLAVVSLTGIVLQGAEASGLGISLAPRWHVVDEVLHTRFGQVWLARAGLALALAAIAVALRRGRREWLLDVALVLCVALIVSPAAAGHASTTGTLSFVMDVIHVQAAALWAGGLAFLLLALWTAGRSRWELAKTAVPRFSNVAVVAVAALVIAGVINAYLQLRGWSALWDTTYGRLVLTKAALVVPVLALAARNNRRAVPRLRAGLASPAERARFVRSTAVELGLLVVVLAVTAVLVAKPPARTLTNPSPPAARSPSSASAD
jgi:copper transport protein